ncbi:MAG: aspartate-semialdehyde dehydrogenase, partial [Sutterella wadsworthensis]|nr:aspartate-semialdehyde dehydrogenase [Sutterella wadsworthensis]
MKALKVGILGATGAVGEQMRIVLAERKFPIAELRLFGSARSAGTEVEFDGKMVKVEEATPEAFEGLDLLLGAADNDVAKKFLPDAAKKGIVVVDNSSAFRLDPEVPLVIPEVNPEDVKWSKGLIANPNCATIIALTAVAALHRKARLRRMVASTYQAVSGAGRGG